MLPTRKFEKERSSSEEAPPACPEAVEQLLSSGAPAELLLPDPCMALEVPGEESVRAYLVVQSLALLSAGLETSLGFLCGGVCITGLVMSAVTDLWLLLLLPAGCVTSLWDSETGGVCITVLFAEAPVASAGPRENKECLFGSLPYVWKLLPEYRLPADSCLLSEPTKGLSCCDCLLALPGVYVGKLPALLSLLSGEGVTGATSRGAGVGARGVSTGLVYMPGICAWFCCGDMTDDRLESECSQGWKL